MLLKNAAFLFFRRVDRKLLEIQRAQQMANHLAEVATRDVRRKERITKMRLKAKAQRERIIREESNAIYIQRWFHGLQLKAELHRRFGTRQDKAAKAIQRRFRGHLKRK